MSTKVKSPDNLPNKPGVYIMRDADDTIIYIGKAKNLVKRVKSYFRKTSKPRRCVLNEMHYTRYKRRDYRRSE